MLVFFFNDTATTEIYTLSLHDALPIYADGYTGRARMITDEDHGTVLGVDRKSTRLNSSHVAISYAVFCLKKKNIEMEIPRSDESNIIDPTKTVTELQRLLQD